MKDFHRDDVKYEEIPTKLSPFMGLCILSLVWTSTSDLPILKIYVQTFFLEKVWLRNTLPTFNLDICPNFRSFFLQASLIEDCNLSVPNVCP